MSPPPVQAGASVRVERVGKSFRGVMAVHDISFCVFPGEVLGVVGPNGAGKTTLVNALTGILSVDHGAIEVAGRRTERMAPHEIAQLGVGRTFQQIRLFQSLSVLENVLCGMHSRFHGKAHQIIFRTKTYRAIEAAARDEVGVLLDKLSLQSIADRQAGQLSYGQQRRVEIARALASNPSVLCLDEPTAGMNQAESKQLASVFRDIAESGVAIVLIEHDMQVVRAVCERLIVLAEGQLLAEGPCSDVLARPDVVAAYLGRPATASHAQQEDLTLGPADRSVGASADYQTPERRPTPEPKTNWKE